MFLENDLVVAGTRSLFPARTILRSSAGWVQSCSLQPPAFFRHVSAEKEKMLVCVGGSKMLWQHHKSHGITHSEQFFCIRFSAQRNS